MAFHHGILESRRDREHEEEGSIVVTINDVARRAAVSATTVSHVLNGTRFVRPETRARVEDAVATLGYRRDSTARALAGGDSHIIGLVISGLTNPYFAPLLHAVERRVTDAGYVLVLGDSHDEMALEQRVIDSLLDRRVDGLIVAPSSGFLTAGAPRITAAGTPLVLIDRGMELECDQVFSESRESSRRLVEHLIEHGHRRIGVVVGLAGLGTTVEREAGVREALAAHGIQADPELIVSGDSRTETSFAAVAALLRRSDRPTALVTLNNSMTIGAIHAIRDAGLRIPGDIALAAYDDFEWSDLFEPRLTAISQDVLTVGSDAVDLLFARIAGSDDPFRRRVIETTLNVRTSCGCQ
ncbi:LacI family DNA-binding transcriptional regulator [Microbacterium sp.]|uniref:LacI family DNA-binding transcriptional regulator n=1 Tax=Microbacterium sp. TaxID=51671 RepID=UPI0039E5FA11